MPRLLSLFMFVNFVVGTSAFVLTGIVADVATSLRTSVAAAGQAMTIYAVATALLAPLLLLATGRWQRKRALMLALLLFTAGNALCALAPDLMTLYAGRVLMGLGAMATPVMSALAVTLVEPQRRARALAYVFLGVSLSYVAGIPVGAWLGSAYGWQTPVWAAAAASALALLVVWQLVPAEMDAPGASFAGLGAVLARGPIAASMLLTMLYFTAIFVVFSYAGPVLRALVPMDATQLSLTLAAFGLAGVAGTLVGGRASDHFGARRTLSVQLGLLASMMALLPLTAGQPVWMLLVLLLWAGAGFGMMAPLQGRLAQLAGPQTPLVLSLNGSMLYLGTALGAAVGGAASVAIGFDKVAWVGLPFALAGWVVLMLSTRAPLVAKPA